MLEMKVRELQAANITETLRREAEVMRQLPKLSLRQRLALLLKAWAEALEPGLEPAVFAKRTHA